MQRLPIIVVTARDRALTQCFSLWVEKYNRFHICYIEFKLLYEFRKHIKLINIIINLKIIFNPIKLIIIIIFKLSFLI